MIYKIFKNYIHFATRPLSVQREEFVVALNSDLPFFTIPAAKGNRSYYFEEEKLNSYYRKLLNNICTERGWKRHIKNYHFFVRKIRIISREAKMAKKLNNKELLKFFKRWVSILKDFSPYVFVPFAIEKFLDNYVREELNKKIYETISSPSKLNNYQKMRLDIINCSLGNKLDAGDLVKKYDWYNEYSYTEPLLGEKHFIREIKKLSEKKAREERNNIIKTAKKNERNFKIAINKIKNKKLKLISKVIHKYTFLRTDRIEEFKKAQRNFRYFYCEITRRIKNKTKSSWMANDAAFFLDREIVNFLSTGSIPKYSEIKNRKLYKYVYYYNGMTRNLITDVKNIKKICEFMAKNEKKNNNLQGLAVSRGVIKGIARIVHSKVDLKKIKKGNVLVAKFTMPDYTSAMRLASAIVVEEGGITSHAAIVARELKKPCIVSVRNCTTLIKEKSLVEVDANKGVVKILKRIK